MTVLVRWFRLRREIRAVRDAFSRLQVAYAATCRDNESLTEELVVLEGERDDALLEAEMLRDRVDVLERDNALLVFEVDVLRDHRHLFSGGEVS